MTPASDRVRPPVALPVVLLMGPTGAGKTRLSFELAANFPAQIVSVDSALVYRGMDVGTAKPTLAERARVVHHLVDIRDPAESYSAGQFVRDAQSAIQSVHAAGQLPVLVGGTMLYFHSLLHGLARLPEGDAAIRAEIDEQAARSGWPALHAELARVDPRAAARIHPNDPQRIQRALEVYRSTGSPLSSLQDSTQEAERAPLASYPRVLLVADIPERAQLHARIEQRLDTMMREGFVDEVRALRARGDLHAELPALRAVGYRQLWGHLEGLYSLEQGRERALTATRQLAKRQMTWLRALSRSPVATQGGLHWIDTTRADAMQRAVGIVRTVAGTISS